jgi:hypothetical protein
MMIWALGRASAAFLISTLVAATASAQQDKTSDVARKSQNPISDLISFPVQENVNFNVGRLDKTQSVTNLQPVVPIKLDQGWTLVTRCILPVIYQPSLVAGDSSDFGLGDFNPSFFLTAPTVGGWTVGVGPTFLLPTATDARLGTDRWSAGPTAVAVLTQGNIVAGVLANNIWSFTGESDHGTVVLRQSGTEIRVGGKPVNQMLLQPFFNYNLPDGWFLVTAPILTADWEAPRGDRWTVPVGGGFGRVFKIGTQPVNANIQAYYHVEHPTDAANWHITANFALLFPD